MIQEPHSPDTTTDTPSQTSESDTQPIEGAGRLGLIFFIASLGMLFAASISGYLVVRFRAEEWPPAGMPPLPDGLLSSTVMIILCSVFIEMAYRAIRADHATRSLRYLWATYGMGWIFLIFQTVGWYHLVINGGYEVPNLYAFTFFMLTGLHAAHVIGGLVTLTAVLFRAHRNAYSAAFHPGIEYNQMYWHFLGVVWIIMYLVLLLTN